MIKTTKGKTENGRVNWCCLFLGVWNYIHWVMGYDR